MAFVVGHLSSVEIGKKATLGLTTVRLCLGIRPDSGTCPGSPTKTACVFGAHAQGAGEA